MNVIEIDLLLGGERLPPREGAEPPVGDYHAFVSRADRRHGCDVYSWNLPDPLPVLPIPLRAPDADVRLDLASLFAMVYDRARYARDVDYARPPSVTLSDERMKWVAAVTPPRPAVG